MADVTIPVGGFNYRIGRLDAMRQYGVARKLTTVLILLGQTIKADADAVKENAAAPEPRPVRPPPGPAEFAKLICAASSGLSGADADEAIGTCLSVVQREVAGDRGWAPVRAPNGQMMYRDIELPELLTLVWHVIDTNGLVDFFSAPSATSAAPAQG